MADIREDGIIGLDFLIEDYYSLGAKTGLQMNRKRYHCILEKLHIVQRLFVQIQ